MTLTLIALFLQFPPIQPFAARLRDAVSLGNQDRVVNLFNKKSDASYLIRMASDRGGLRSLKVAIIPAPPGWEATGNYWAVIHTRQDIEEHHDPVYPVIVSGDDWKLGTEIPQDATTGAQITSAAMDVRILAAASKVEVHTVLNLSVTATSQAPLFRLNDDFHVQSADAIGKAGETIIEVGDTIPSPQPGDVVHAGSLLIPWTKKISPREEFDYTGTISSANEDKIDSEHCYLTAMWVPSLGQLPFTTSTRVVGPGDWVLESEGKRIDAEDSLVKPKFQPATGEQVKYFQCDLPISFPKVIGGKYIVAAEQTVDGRTFRAYHLTETTTIGPRRTWRGWPTRSPGTRTILARSPSKNITASTPTPITESRATATRS